MNRLELYDKWITTAYQMFAEKGLEGFNVKNIASRGGLTRSSFYYYFENKDDLIDAVIEYYFDVVIRDINITFQERLVSFLPDFYDIVFEFSEAIQFTKQLFRNKESEPYTHAHKQGIALTAEYIVPEFKAYLKIDLETNEVKELWYTLADAWFSRLDFNDYSVQTLTRNGVDIWNSICLLSGMKDLKKIVI